MTSRLRRCTFHIHQVDVLGWAGLLIAGLLACGVAGAQGVVVTPSVTVTETLTSNRDLSSSDRQADLITQVSPGISLSSSRGALQGSLSYSLNGVAYARQSSANSVYHSLSGLGSFKAMDGGLGIDASASAGRQLISAFGTQSSSVVLNNGNQAQVFSYSLSPFITGRLLGSTTYQLRGIYSASRSDAASLGDSTSMSASAGLAGRWGVLGWTVDGSRSATEHGDQPRGHTGRLGFSLTYQADAALQLVGRAGREVDDVRTGQSQRTATWGAGASWRPGPRTSAQLEFDRRYFGRSHLFSISHRMANTIWAYTDSRNLENGGAAGRSVVSLYDQLFAQNASIEPDPIKRDILVRNFLAANGLDGSGQVVVGGFLTAAPAVQRTQVASAAYQGLRATMSIAIVQTTSRSVSVAANTGDDLAGGIQPRQRGLSLSLSHRLTPESAIVITAAQQRTAQAGALSGNDLRSIAATWSATLGPHTNVSLGARYSNFDSDSNPYQESAVFGSIRLRF